MSGGTSSNWRPVLPAENLYPARHPQPGQGTLKSQINAAEPSSPPAPTPPLAILRLKQITERTGLKTSTLYAMMGRGEFVRPVRPSAKAVGWRSDHIEAWIQSRESVAHGAK